MEKNFDNTINQTSEISRDVAVEAYKWTDAYDYGRIAKASGEAAGLVEGTETLDNLNLWELIFTAAPILPGRLGKYADKAGNIKTLRNAKLAGKIHPVSGVPFNKHGLPDFSNFLYKEGANTVKIKPTGSRASDFVEANRVAGYSETPKDYTWHHSEEKGVMQLVKTTIHRKTGHTGGFALWEE